jgi:predicted Rossmann fold nucleotide-binding protein DprA/Smf involved in DNA uptake
LNDDENAVLAAIAEEPLSIEVICDTLGLPPAKVAVALTDLQLKGAVQRSTGDIYSARNSSRA